MKFLELKVPPVALVIIFMESMYLLSRNYPLLTFELNIAIPIITILSVQLAAIGIVIAATGVIGFKKAKTTVDPTNPNKADNLVTGGIYKLTRNPMYVGMLLFLLGWAVYLSSLSAVLLVPIFVFYMNQYQIKPEEKILSGLFGDKYDDYMTEVRRWF